MQKHTPMDSMQSEDAASGCPLHIAMRRLAEAAVAQHIRYSQGEMAPRPELMADLLAWNRLHTLTLRAICPALRDFALAPGESATSGPAQGGVDAAARAAIDALPDDVTPSEREELYTSLMRCAAGSRGDPCPFR
jgi:hypothetical protein